MSCRSLAIQVSVVLILLSSKYSQALDPHRMITQYIQDVWQTEDGLPQNTVLAITQSQQGYLWLATNEGVVRFNGTEFKLFNKENVPAFRHNNIWSLHEDRTGALWIGTSAGIVRHHRGIFENFMDQPEMLKGEVWSIYEDRLGNLWFGTDGNGLLRLSDGRITQYTTDNGLSNNTVWDILEDNNGDLLIGTSYGLNRLRNGRFTVLTTEHGLSHNTICALLRDKRGGIWIGTRGGGVNLYQGGEFTIYSTRDGLSGDMIYSLYEDRDGNIWIGAKGGGLTRRQNDRFESITKADGLSSDNVFAIFEDREGSLWIGTRGGGLNRFRNGKFLAFTTKEGLSNENILSIYEDRRGNIWVGTDGGGLDLIRQNKLVPYAGQEALRGAHVFSLVEDREGSLWIGTDHQGLLRLRNGVVTSLNTRNGLLSNSIRSLYEDRNGTLWIGTGLGGLSKFSQGQITTYSNLEGLTDNIVLSILEDRSGNLWIGTDGNGLNQWKNGRFLLMPETRGLSIRCIYEDIDGTLWIGTSGGLFRYYRDTFTRFTTRDGLLNDFIVQILEDGKGNLWMSSNRGIFSVHKQELRKLAEEGSGVVQSIHYDRSDGMPSSECNGYSQPAGWRSADGRLWFPTVKGVVAIDPKNMATNESLPSVVIEQIIADEISWNRKSDEIVFHAGTERLEFHYTGLSFLVPNRVQYRFRLEGLDTDWVEAGNRKVAYYTNIPPGNYRFRVTACNDDGVWNEAGAFLNFSMKARFYQTYWFYSLCALGVLLAGWTVHRYRLGRAMEMERLRTRLATDLHDDIGSGLSQIAILSEVVQTKTKQEGEEVSEPLVRIAEASRKLIDSMSDIVWAVNPNRDRAADLIQRMRRFASEVLSASNIDFSFRANVTEAERILNPEMRRELYLVFKEAVNNIQRHSSASYAEIEFQINRNRVLMVIRDNGVGFSCREPGEGNGIQSMRRRTQTLGGEFQFISEPGHGTELLLRVPLSKRKSVG